MAINIPPNMTDEETEKWYEGLSDADKKEFDDTCNLAITRGRAIRGIQKLSKSYERKRKGEKK